MLATSTVTEELATLFRRLVELERLTCAQEWWLYGRVLPEARHIAEITSLLTAARADIGQLLAALGQPQRAHLPQLGTGELHFAQSFAGDQGWALAHHDEAVSVLHLAALAVPILLGDVTRITASLGQSSIAALARQQMRRVMERLSEMRALAAGY